MKKFVWIIIVGLLIVGGALVFKNIPKTSEQNPLISPANNAPRESESSNTLAPVVPASIREVTVTGADFSFSPKDITVKAGERIKLIFRNTGAAPHNWKVEGLNIGTRTIGGGQTDMLEFTAPTTPGVFNYTFFCGVPGHREAGMAGRLIVEQ